MRCSAVQWLPGPWPWPCSCSPRNCHLCSTSLQQSSELHHCRAVQWNCHLCTKAAPNTLSYFSSLQLTECKPQYTSVACTTLGYTPVGHTTLDHHSQECLCPQRKLPAGASGPARPIPHMRWWTFPFYEATGSTKTRQPKNILSIKYSIHSNYSNCQRFSIETVWHFGVVKF